VGSSPTFGTSKKRSLLAPFLAAEVRTRTHN
jgi:hypothetical protein